MQSTSSLARDIGAAEVPSPASAIKSTPTTPRVPRRAQTIPSANTTACGPTCKNALSGKHSRAKALTSPAVVARARRTAVKTRTTNCERCVSSVQTANTQRQRGRAGAAQIVPPASSSTTRRNPQTTTANAAHQERSAQPARCRAKRAV